MEITINIIDRNYDQIKEFCDFNNILIEDYIVRCVEDDFFTRKYGDLNEKLNPPKVEEKPPQQETKKEETTEKKKVGRPKKVKEETTTVVENKIEDIVKDKEQFLIRVEDVVDTTDKTTETKIRKRTLKTR